MKLNGAKIIVTATDSLAFSLASRYKMYENIQFVDATYITFGEYSRLTGISTIDDYIKNGSTLRTDIFSTKQSTDKFIETAVVNNIIRSLDKSENIHPLFVSLTEKYSEAILKNEIKKIIDRHIQTKIHNAITDLSLFSLLNDNDFKIISNKIKLIFNCDQIYKIENRDVKKIESYLYDIGVFHDISFCYAYPKQNDDESAYLFNHPGMLHANLLYTLRLLKEDPSWRNAKDPNKMIFLEKVYEFSMKK